MHAALVEALMGFQFNHVGGGTKTRRPIALHMKYNGACMEPSCFLLDEQGADRDVTLLELQDYIEAENQRLNAAGQFQNKDIVIRIEYKYCPNLTIIDTPGALAALRGTNERSFAQCKHNTTRRCCAEQPLFVAHKLTASMLRH
jgi:Dynamin family